jgi:hypothetical protein
MKVGFVFECGREGPDLKVFRHFVGRLKPEIEFIPRTLDNKPNLIEHCGIVANELLRECAKVAIIWDLFPPWREKKIRPCRREDRKAIIQALQSEGVDLDKVVLVCIQEELKAWLLADRRAVSAMLARLKQPHQVGKIPRFSNPDRIRNPKARLTKIFNEELGPNRRYVDYRHALRIAEQIPDFQRLRRSDSFRRFALKIACVAV